MSTDGRSGGMERVNRLLALPVYRARLDRLTELEQERVFCRHGLPHLLDTARILWIHVLEEGLPLERETVYAAALLHDLGRLDQLEQGIPHQEAGTALAEELLPQAGFSAEETAEIADAIRTHRGSCAASGRSTLGELLYRADKESRQCWKCPAQDACNWPEERKNTGILR